MQSMNRLFSLTACAALALTLSASNPAIGDVVYDNTDSFLGSISFTQLQIGDEIVIDDAEAIISEMEIGLTQQGFAGLGDLQFRLYANDGADGKPGTLLWESDLFDDVAFTGDHDLISVAVPDVTVPQAFTWTVQISDTRPVAVGLPHYDPPSIGASPDYAWFGDGSSWTLLESSFGPVNFMCRIHSSTGGGGPVLSILGSCPGRMRFEVIGAQANERVAYLYARGEGSVEIPPGNPCAGTSLGLNATVALAGVVRADGEGVAQLDANVPSGACGRIYIQAIGVDSCATTNVVRIE